MKRLITAVGLAAALVLPAAPAGASQTAAIVRVTDCPPGYTGYVVQAWSDWGGWYDVVWFCIPFGP